MVDYGIFYFKEGVSKNHFSFLPCKNAGQILNDYK